MGLELDYGESGHTKQGSSTDLECSEVETAKKGSNRLDLITHVLNGRCDALVTDHTDAFMLGKRGVYEVGWDGPRYWQRCNGSGSTQAVLQQQ